MDPQIKLIDEDTDFSKIKKLPWDTYCCGNLFDVYRIEDHYHSIGGKWGNNNYWACERDKKPTLDNLVEFSGDVCSWTLKFEESNSMRYKYGESEMMSCIGVSIERNEKKFYHFVVSDMDYGISKARLLLFEIHEHPIRFNNQNYQNEIIGRKILFREKPCIIESYYSGSVIIVPDGWDISEYKFYDGDRFIKDDIFSPSINWFR